MSGIQRVSQILDQLLPSRGLIEKWRVDRIQGNHGDGDRLLSVEREIAEGAGGIGHLRRARAAGGYFFESANPLLLAVFHDLEIFLGQVVNVAAEFVGD